MKLVGIIMLGLIAALFAAGVGVSETHASAAHLHFTPVLADHHPNASHDHDGVGDHKPDEITSKTVDHHAKDATRSPDECDSTCCTFACHAFDIGIVNALKAPAFSWIILPFDNDPGRRDSAPLGQHRPPRLA